MARGKIRIVVAALCLMLVYFCAGFYPFELKSLHEQWRPNGATLSNATLQFSAPGMAYSDGPPPWLAPAIADAAITISLQVRSALPRQFGPARILSLSAHPLHRNLVIAQQDEHLVVRIRRPSHPDGLPSYRINHVFADTGWHKLLVRITREQVEIRADAVALTLPASDPLATWDKRYLLTLGNERAGTLPWLGEIRAVRVDARGSYDILAAGSLHIPPRYQIRRDYPPRLIPFIHTPVKPGVVLDWLLNLAGFMPLGWLLFRLAGGKWGLLLATLAGAGISAAIEGGQLWLFAHRVPSTEDLILNTLGSVLGATASQYVSRRRQAEPK